MGPKCQYFVWPPLFSSTALTLLGMEFTRASQVATGVLFHSSMIQFRCTCTMTMKLFIHSFIQKCPSRTNSSDIVVNKTKCIWILINNDHLKPIPFKNMPRGLFYVAGSERPLSHPGSPPSQTTLDSYSKGWHINTRSCCLGCLWLPALLHDAWIRLSPLWDRWESIYSTTSTTGSFRSSRRWFWHHTKTLLLSHLGCLGLRVNFAKNILWPSQRVSFLGTVIDSVQNSAPRSFLQGRHRPSAQSCPEDAGPYGSVIPRYFGWVCFICDPSSSGWNRELHPWLGVTDTTA